MYKFAIIGVGGYVAKKHVKAIYDNNGTIIAAHDTSDSVGFLDSFSYDIPFYTSRQEFINKLSTANYLAVCTPNYLHREHIELGLTHGTDVICEKPLCLDIHDINYIKNLENRFNKKCWTILQSRYNQNIDKLKKDIEAGLIVKEATVEYLTPRGSWYLESWKGVDIYSGGLIFNIGIHLIDIIQWLFGSVVDINIIKYDNENTKGIFKTETTTITWNLSVEKDIAPTEPIRILTVDGRKINLSEKFTDLHTESYKRIISNKGIRAEEARPAIELATKVKEITKSKIEVK